MNREFSRGISNPQARSATCNPKARQAFFAIPAISVISVVDVTRSPAVVGYGKHIKVLPSLQIARTERLAAVLDLSLALEQLITQAAQLLVVRIAIGMRDVLVDFRLDVRTALRDHGGQRRHHRPV